MTLTYALDFQALHRMYIKLCDPKTYSRTLEQQFFSAMLKFSKYLAQRHFAQTTVPAVLEEAISEAVLKLYYTLAPQRPDPTKNAYQFMAYVRKILLTCQLNVVAKEGRQTQGFNAVSFEVLRRYGYLEQNYADIEHALYYQQLKPVVFRHVAAHCVYQGRDRIAYLYACACFLRLVPFDAESVYLLLGEIRGYLHRSHLYPILCAARVATQAAVFRFFDHEGCEWD